MDAFMEDKHSWQIRKSVASQNIYPNYKREERKTWTSFFIKTIFFVLFSYITDLQTKKK